MLLFSKLACYRASDISCIEKKRPREREREKAAQQNGNEETQPSRQNLWVRPHPEIVGMGNPKDFVTVILGRVIPVIAYCQVFDHDESQQCSHHHRPVVGTPLSQLVRSPDEPQADRFHPWHCDDSFKCTMIHIWRTNYELNGFVCQWCTMNS